MALERTPPLTRMPAEPDSAAGSPPGRVLVVDDLEANIDIFTRLLAHDGHVVDHASKRFTDELDSAASVIVSPGTAC